VYYRTGNPSRTENARGRIRVTAGLAYHTENTEDAVSGQEKGRDCHILGGLTRGNLYIYALEKQEAFKPKLTYLASHL